ncbi:MAG: hypothetical protein ACOY82_06185 [Pseudomonadota bacterium]
MVGDNTRRDSHVFDSPRVRLGFVGSREFPQAIATLESRLQEVWAEAANASPGCVLRLVGGMADGADRAAVRSFLAWRGSDAHEVLAIYPCAPYAFFKRSGVYDRQGFKALRRALLKDDHCAELSLDGAMPRTATWASGKTEQTKLAREKQIRGRSHEFQAEVLLRQCECLIAAYDPQSPGGMGGTRQTIARALGMGMPVLLLAPDDVIWMPKDHADLSGGAPAVSADWKLQFREAIRARSAVGAADHLGGHDATHRTGHAERDLTDDIDALISGTLPTRVAAPAGWEPLRRFWEELSHEYAESVRIRLFGESEGVGREPEPRRPEIRLGRLLRAAKLAWRKRDEIPEASRRMDESPVSERWRRAVSRVQDSEMRAYRGLYLQSYLLGLIAVALALSALCVLGTSGSSIGLCAIFALMAIASAKFFVVRKIQQNTREGIRGAHADNAVNLRCIAEQLRVLPMLRLSGSTRVDLVRRDSRRTRSSEVVDRLCARLPLRDCAVAHDSASALWKAIDLLREQGRYHVRTHASMDAMDRTLERFGAWAGSAVIAIVVADLILLLLKLAVKLASSSALLDDGVARALSGGLGLAGLFAVLLTALLPAFMATVNAIRFQSMCEQLADRHGAMAEALARMRREGIELRSRVGGSTPKQAGADVLMFAERCASLLVSEVSEWGTMYRQEIKEA